jgi:hypothetical protein
MNSATIIMLFAAREIDWKAQSMMECFIEGTIDNIGMIPGMVRGGGAAGASGEPLFYSPIRSIVRR